MDFKKVTEKDKDGNNVDVLKVVTTVGSVVRERTTTIQEQEDVLDSLKLQKAREIKRWDDRIALQKQRVVDAAGVMGQTIDPSTLDTQPTALPDTSGDPIYVNGQPISQYQQQQQSGGNSGGSSP